jgi:hypothetical protein
MVSLRRDRIVSRPSSTSTSAVYGQSTKLTMNSIWKAFIPHSDRHIFEKGAYFSKEVIPNRLAVISLNTLFWYDSNTRKSIAMAVLADS